ncbi:MAG: extracellular solute-binding protein [Lachnospiraceae bacterium]
MSLNRFITYIFPLTLAIFLTAGCQHQTEPAITPAQPDLVVFTSQEETVYKPVLKEYQERSGLNIRIISGTFQDLQLMLEEGTLAQTCDVVFGINAATLESNREHWEAYSSSSAAALDSELVPKYNTWTPFSTVPLVIMYNTKVVTYRELPEDWSSLLEPRWRGRIAFMDPEVSDIYATSLVVAMYASGEPDSYLENLAANLEYQTYGTLPEVNHAVSDGRCSIGVTLEKTAESLRREDNDIDYIYPESGTCVFLDGSAVISGCNNPAAARSFLDFTVNTDTQNILVTDLGRRSVRSDIAPPSGLKPISQLNVYSIQPGQLSDALTPTLKKWHALIDRYSQEGR